VLMTVPEHQNPEFKINSEADSVFLGVLDSCNPEIMFSHKQEDGPIALNIHFQKNLAPDYPQLLAREMSMYFHRCGKRNAVKTWLRGTPLNGLGAGEITEIAFLMANYFNMDESPHSEYGFECDVSEINTNNLSLMKGLRFTTLLLNIDASMPPENTAMPSAIDLIQQYKFHEIHFRLHTKKACRSTLYHWLGYLSKSKPVLLEISEIETVLNGTIKLDEMADLMAKQGYVLLGDRFFVVKEHPLVELKYQGKLQYTPPWGASHPDIKDWVGLGVGAIGKIGQTFYQNLRKESDYVNDLSLGKLPICCSGKHSNKEAQHTWTMIQQLICLHRISLQQHLLSNRSLRKIKQALEKACQSGWMGNQGMDFVLKREGLNHLRDICRDLQQY